MASFLKGEFMENIKFRAWDEDQNRMYYPKDNGLLNKSFNLFQHSKLGLRATKNTGENSETYPLKLMQYTGLKDKNGKEIYEGDIVQYFSNWNQTEEYKEKYAENYLVKFKNGKFTYCRPGASTNKGDVIEVIGNKYENPELLN